MLKTILFSMLLVAPLSAAIHHNVDTTKPLCCGFSFRHHNRVLVDGGRVKKVIFAEDKVSVRMEEVSGQVFVQAKQPMPETTLISVITQNGQVQDIEISLSDRAPQVIVLRENTPQKSCTQPISQVSCPQSYASIKTTIACILTEKVPAGYRSIPFQGCEKKLKSGVTLKLVAKLQGAQDDLFIYQVLNHSCIQKKVTEKQICDSSCRWTYLSTNTIKSKKSALAIKAVCH